MKHRIKLLIIWHRPAAAGLPEGRSCNLNTPVVGDLVRKATKEQPATLVVGLESGTRLSITTNYMESGTGILGLEMLPLFGSEPRWTTEMMGTGELDNNTFYTTNLWTSRYRVVRQGNILDDATSLMRCSLQKERVY